MYNNLHIYVSGRVANLLNLENENNEDLIVILKECRFLLEKTFNKYDLHIFVSNLGYLMRIIEGKI